VDGLGFRIFLLYTQEKNNYDPYLLEGSKRTVARISSGVGGCRAERFFERPSADGRIFAV
jgi:hypothetical protein